MDPMTQSAQISSSQGFADGQNSAAKGSKLSDSFLSSSPVSLIQSPQDKRVVLGSDKPCEGVATSLRFPSQLGSFTPGNYGSEAGPPDEQPDSPIKTSPVSERIKALEALAAKEKQPDFRSDRGFSHFKDHHHEKSPPETLKSPTEKIAPTVQKKGTSANPESPESPFEVLGDLRQVNEFEETATWMKAHLPPVPDYDAVDVIKGTPASDNVTSKEEKETPVVMPDAPMTFPNVPEAFMDTPVESPKMKDKFCEEQKQTSVEEESEFDLSFLPTAYVWEQPEKSSAEPASELSSVLPASPIPPTDFVSHSIVLPPVDTDSKQDVSADKGPTSSGELEPQEATEADSSGESDDTVIEDGISVPPPSSYPTVINESTTTPTSTPSDVLTEEKETPPPRSERKLMQVPTINVIETDEPNYSEEEMEMEPEAEEDEDYEAVKDLASEAPKTPEPESDDSENEPPRTRRLETEFMEGYSPPSSPVDSDAEPSPDVSETVNRESASKPEAVLKENDEASDFSKAQSEKTQTSCRNEEPSPFIVTNEVDFPDNDDEWSDEAQDILVKTQMEQKFIEPTLCTQSKVDEKSNVATKEVNMEGVSLAKTSFMQDDIYDRQSFDYDYDASSALDDIDDQGTNDAKECFLSDTTHTHFDTMSSSIAQNDSPKDKHNMEDLISVNNDEALSMTAAQPFLTSYPQDPYSFQIETLNSINEQDFSKQMTTDIVNENMTNGNSHSGEKIDSEIQENAKTGHYVSDATSSLKSIDPDSSVSEPTDSFVDFMRECLKSKQDEEDDSAQQDVPSKDEVCKTVLPPPQSPSTMVMDLEQEQLTISALKELGSSQEEEAEEVVSLQSRVPDHDDVAPIAASIQKSSFTSVPIAACSQSSTYSKEVEAIDEWVAEAYHLAEHVLTAILTHLSVKDLIHWRDPKKSGVVFGLSMLLLLSLAAFSVISVVSYLLLALLCVTITFRIYKSVVQAVQKSSEGHPFKSLIDKDVSIPPETFRKHVDTSLTYVNRALKQMSRLFLVEDLVDSLKLAVVMWLLTYVGAVFNGITILILADILLFAVPPIYEKNKTQIDQYIDLARTQVNTTMAKLQEKLPGAMRRSKTE